ncbi:MAG: DUF1599 domain-containing protein [Bernardetiaceae bacterium]|nr:DUF1599 domain-containing protein [Bernardetiaceae bacterium]
MTDKTLAQYRQVIAVCRELFERKNKDYGTSWRILRLPSITDQIYIKARRIRTIQEKGKQLVSDDVLSEFIGIINYGIVALMQSRLKEDGRLDVPLKEVVEYYSQYVENSLKLLSRKNHDYGEAWRVMRVGSITDIILMRLLRIKRIEDNEGKTMVSEGVDANYYDIVNYAVFAMILLQEEAHPPKSNINQNQIPQPVSIEKS